MLRPRFFLVFAVSCGQHWLRRRSSTAYLALRQPGNGSFDDFVSAQHDRVGKFDAECFRGFQVYCQLERGWLFDGEICRFRTLENFVDVGGRTAILISKTRPIGDEAAGIDKIARFVHGWNALLSSELDNERSLASGKRINQYQKRLGMFTNDRCEGLVQLTRVAYLHGANGHAYRRSHEFGLLET